MAEDMWLDDPHAPTAHVERLLSDVGAGYLYRVHLDAHMQLGLPTLPAAQVQAIYRTPAPLPTMAKAYSDEQRRSGSNAARIFAELSERRVGPSHAAQLAEAVTDNWFAHGLVSDRAQAANIKAYLIGQVQAADEVPTVPPQVVAWRNVADPERRHMLEFAAYHAAEHAKHLKAQTRHRIASRIYDALLSGESPQQLAVQLGHEFGTLNRDWRRLAITEVAYARAHGFISGLPAGSKVEWFAAADACKHCRRYHGKQFTVRHGPGDWETEVWPGKVNVGRAFAAVKRSGELRTPSELAGPTIPLHPNCRCRWLRVAERPEGVSDRLEAYLAELAQS